MILLSIVSQFKALSRFAVIDPDRRGIRRGLGAEEAAAQCAPRYSVAINTPGRQSWPLPAQSQAYPSAISV